MSEGRSDPTRPCHCRCTVHNITASTFKIPIFLCGHSMGGTTIFTYACTGPPDQIDQIRGFMGESPDFGFPDGAPARPGWIERQLLNALIHIYPSVQMKRPLDPTILSPDVAVQKRYLSDSHHTFAVEGLMGHFDRVKKLVSHEVKLSSDVRSIWMGHGTMDLCTDYDATKKWLQEIDIEDKELRTYEGCLHNLHAEIPEVRERFATDVADWILSRID